MSVISYLKKKKKNNFEENNNGCFDNLKSSKKIRNNAEI